MLTAIRVFNNFYLKNSNALLYRTAVSSVIFAVSKNSHKKNLSYIIYLLSLLQSNAPPELRIYEVGPRDGLQNEAKFVPTEIKIELINKLAEAGIKDIESARWENKNIRILCY